MLKRAESIIIFAESHRCEVNTQGILACNFSTFFKVSQPSLKGIHFRKPLPESERNDRFWPKKYLKIIEHVSYSISIAKYHCLYTQGAVAFQTPGLFDSTCTTRTYLKPRRHSNAEKIWTGFKASKGLEKEGESVGSIFEFHVSYLTTKRLLLFVPNANATSDENGFIDQSYMLLLKYIILEL